MQQTSIKQLLAETIGLEPASVGEPALRRSVQSRMLACGLSSMEAYVDRLRESTEEMTLLIDEVVIPETWFFRDPETFQTLIRWAAGRSSPGGTNEIFRAMSVGCCTGEEPYSIAMALLDAGLSADQFIIDAIDASARVIHNAEKGFYRGNSFRTEDLGFREHYFRPEPGGYQLSETVRNRVHFSSGSITDETFGAGRSRYQAVFCRNVMIYFDEPAQERAVNNLRNLLAPDGVLLAGPAESFLLLQKGFTPTGLARGFVLENKQPARTSAMAVPRASSAILQPAWAIPKTKMTRAFSQKPVQVVPDLEQAAQLANSGKLGEAAEICRSYLLKTGPAAKAYYLLGLVLDAMNRKTEAADSYKKALYLEPDHLETLTQFALLAANMGDHAAAARLHERIRRAETRTAQ